MIKINWAGHSCFHISVSNSKETSRSIVTDPFNESIGLKLPSLTADILLISHDHYDHNNIKGVKGNPFLISGPGEYEIKEIFIQGISSFHDEKEGKERGLNTIYTIKTEDIKICHLGDLGQKELTNDQLEKIGNVDILMVPVGGVYTIDADGAKKIVSQIEPKIVIPMHYNLPNLKIKLAKVEEFLKAMGKSSITSVDKLSLKASMLPKEEIQIITFKL